MRMDPRTGFGTVFRLTELDHRAPGLLLLRMQP